MLISHRFSTVRTADRIHIFDQGRIIESGTHEELVALGGRYAEMYEVQARAYQTGGRRERSVKLVGANATVYTSAIRRR